MELDKIDEQEIIDGLSEGLKVVNNGLEKLHKDIGKSLSRQEKSEEDILREYLTDKKPVMPYY